VAELRLPQLDQPALFDTGVWTWVRDRRFPELATWFNAAVEAGLVLVCDLVILELTRLAPNADRAHEVADRLAAFETIPMPAGVWARARHTQLALATSGDHRRVPPADLLLASAAELAGVVLIHYDRDYERIASTTGGLRHEWLVPDGTLAQDT
jgi:predicted nucleic acid-binding protein